MSGRAELAAWGAGLVGLAGAMLGWAIEPAAFADAWLAGLLTWLLWPTGALALLLAHSLTGGRWGGAARPGLVAGVATLPLVIPGLVPLLLDLPGAYHWAQPGELGHVRNGGWLNPGFFSVRVIVEALLWLGIGRLVLGRVRGGVGLAAVAPPCLIALALSFTFGVFDLGMSLEDFTSNIYGMMCAADAALVALAAATLVAAGIVPRERLADLAKLQLAFVVLWTYLDFMQLLIVWQSNLASDAGWYVRRTTPYWGTVAIVVELFRFVVPFGVLIFAKAQRSPLPMRVVSWMLVATTVLRGWWLVLPSQSRGIGLVDLACLLTFGGGAMALALRSLARSGQTVQEAAHV